MKTRTLTIFSLTLLICTSLFMTACKKFSLLKDEELPSIPAGANLKNETIWQFLSDNDFHSNDLTKVGLYGKIVQLAGLQDLFNSAGDYTAIIPSDGAINTFLQSLGAQSINDVSPVVWKNLVLNNLIPKRVRSFDLPANQAQVYLTVSQDSLFLTRTPSSTNQYVLFVNQSSTVNSNSVIVRTQNLEFKNAIGHVIDGFTYYVPKTKGADPVNPGSVSYATDTIPITKDSYVNAGTTTLMNTNYGSLIYMIVMNTPTNMSFTRRALLQFPIRKPSFNNRIGSVKVAAFINRIDGAGTITVQEDQNVDWQENKVTWANAPVPGTIPLSSFPVTTANNFSWQYGTITSAYMDALAANRTFINIGLFTTSNTINYQFATKEAAANRRPYLLISSAANTVLKDLVNNGLVVDSKVGYKTISTDDLSLSGTADNNIFYTVKTLPANGSLVINNLPAKVGSAFSQELLKKGGVKYLYSGNGGADKLVLEASDFQNGYYNSLINLNITIN
ncbi:DNRLRE domain-containing protein [Mucilaginibacter sp. RS28]|uniref:DNRLRE domain-containing protein n=1 Tax=Mucilaginibacter straminoryzae TaxID=2932774 RepID=A0A9X1X2X2_9SPHI|nr:DNRLRE domain-containing protein [Mucilaginibacter straminoryzae]MCJ8209005.1 DNRLRE domain-containing protein [Mucilaginibacter straminoryzae]